MSSLDLQRIAPLEETDPDAQRHVARVKAEHDAQYLALRRRAQGLFETLKGRTGLHSPEEFERISDRVWNDFDSGAFLVNRLGTSRYTDPELAIVLVRLRAELLAEIRNPSASDRMNVDMAVLGYRNALRVQSFINSALMEAERQLFGQHSLEEVVGQTEAREVRSILEEVEQKLLPLLEKSQKMMNRALDRLAMGSSRARSKGDQGRAGVAVQVNVGGTSGS